jgi:hypothetical protein
MRAPAPPRRRSRPAYHHWEGSRTLAALPYRARPALSGQLHIIASGPAPPRPGSAQLAPAWSLTPICWERVAYYDHNLFRLRTSHPVPTSHNDCTGKPQVHLDGCILAPHRLPILAASTGTARNHWHGSSLPASTMAIIHTGDQLQLSRSTRATVSWLRSHRLQTPASSTHCAHQQQGSLHTKEPSAAAPDGKLRKLLANTAGQGQLHSARGVRAPGTNETPIGAFIPPARISTAGQLHIVAPGPAPSYCERRESTGSTSTPIAASIPPPASRPQRARPGQPASVPSCCAGASSTSTR